MNAISDNEIVARPTWVRACGWLWPRLCYIWATVIVGDVLTTLFNNGPDRFAWLTQSQYRPIALACYIGLVALIVLTIVVGLGNYVGIWRTAVPESPEQRNRERFLARLRRRYKDCLDQSLQGAAVMALGLEEQASAVLRNATHLRIRSTAASAHQLPAGTTLLQAFDAANGDLLILGEAGSGKTTLLLDLALKLCACAEQDEQHMFPVIFHLSSWPVKLQPLSDWLIEELTRSYEVPRRLSQTWILKEQIIPLLDGLDELPAHDREACIDAINIYHQEHYLPLVVCSQTHAYRTLHKCLSLDHIIVVQPLSRQQVETYLKIAGEPLAALREVLREKPVLYELMTTPLMLNILTLAYRGMSVQSLPVLSQMSLQQDLEIYVQHMLEQAYTSRNTQQRIKERLAWLAKKMRQQEQSVFYLEQLQPTWLTYPWLSRIYNWFAGWLPGALIGLFIGTAFFSVYAGLVHFKSLLIAYVAFFGLPGSLLGGFLSGRRAEYNHNLGTSNTRTLKSFWRCFPWRPDTSLFVGLSYGLAASLLYSLFYGLNAGLNVGLRTGLVFGLFFGLIFGLLQGRFFKRIVAIEEEKHPRPSSRSRRSIWQRLTGSCGGRNGVIIGLVFGSTFMMVYGLAYGLVSGPSEGLRQGLGSGLFYCLPYGLIAGLLSTLLIGKGTMIQATDQIRWSWEALKKSLLSKQLRNNALLVTGITLLATLAAGFSSSRFSSLALDTPISPTKTWDFILSSTLLIGLTYWLLIVLFSSVSSVTLADKTRDVPNQGIRRSVRNGLVLGAASATIIAVICSLNAWGVHELLAVLRLGSSQQPIPWLDGGLNTWQDSGLITGICVGLLICLLNGGLAYWRHYTLRFLLWISRSIPWRYPQFLDEAADCILLRQEGAGYAFIHDLLLNYFADLDTPAPGSFAN